MDRIVTISGEVTEIELKTKELCIEIEQLAEWIRQASAKATTLEMDCKSSLFELEKKLELLDVLEVTPQERTARKELINRIHTVLAICDELKDNRLPAALSQLFP
jgi:hypothetical protein